MYRPDIGAYLTVISHNRVPNVPKMQELIGDATWFISKGERQAYCEAGVKYAYESGGLMRSRNQALEKAFDHNRVCIQLSDDLQGIKRCVWRGAKSEGIKMDFVSAAKYLVDCLGKTPFKLGGCAPTSNAFYFDPKKPFSYNGFIVGDFILVHPTDLMFDEVLHLKEDYDYTAQHITKYGGVCRANMIMPVFSHRTNAGGCKGYRTPELEEAAIAHLMQKWPGYFYRNTKRENEIIMKVPAEICAHK